MDRQHISAVKNFVVSRRIFRPALSAWFGSKLTYRYFASKLLQPYMSTLTTGEYHNFTYDLTSQSRRYLINMIAVITGQPRDLIRSYIDEVAADRDLASYLETAGQGKFRKARWAQNPFGRRVGWYAIVRAVKPEVVVETGVERGHGSLILCAALERNAREGFAGRHYGLDIDPTAGDLLGGKYKEHGEILYGDSITTLRSFPHKINLFINDSDHSAEYEAEEYRTIESKLSGDAIILGDNSHDTDKLAVFAETSGRQFLFFREEPERHWYPGAGIGFAFKAKA